MPVPNACDVEALATGLLDSLTAGQDFTLPEVDFGSPEYQLPDVPETGTAVARISNDDLTTTQIDGTGTFDVLMRGFATHLHHEFTAGRITSNEYAKVYIALVESAMSTGVQFLLGKEQAYWGAVTARLHAITAQTAVVTARVELATAKVRLQALRYEALTQRAAYGLAQMKIASESAAYCTARYTLEHILPTQHTLLTEQGEAQRAQTSDTRSDGLPVAGAIGKQKELHTQQVVSYQRDGESKIGKMFIDAWIAMKTMDDGLQAPDGFTNANIDTILAALRANSGLG